MIEEKRGKEFELITNPNVAGISSPIKMVSLPINVTNGSNFSRKGSYLDCKYYLEKEYERGSINTHTDDQKDGVGKGKLLSIKLDGFR